MSSTNKKNKQDKLEDLHHDIKNQITSIKVFNQLIKKKSEKKEIQEYSDSVDEKITNLLELLDDLFDEEKDR